MGEVRKSFQGVSNIIRFNWHFYVLSLTAIVGLVFLTQYINEQFHVYCYLICILILSTTFISLLVSYYIYDLSGLYKLNWLNNLVTGQHASIVNINAGFDETSILLKNKYVDSMLSVYDFYDPLKHTEVSIKRAREAYPRYPGTIQVKTAALPLKDKSADIIFIMFAAHEIRDEEERIKFFNELRRVLKPTGQIVITEHLRDGINFLAYNIGFFHFYSKTIWYSIFKTAQLQIHKEIKLTPFISAFILKPDGDTL